jgi:pyridoxal phosphate enzyme (YggS family)
MTTPDPAAVDPADLAVRERIRANLAAIGERIAAACAQSGRDPASVRLVAVTKYVDVATARAVHEAGCHDLAESRPQALWTKAAGLGDLTPAPCWHLVGHLQRNKIRKTLPVLGLLHSLDSVRLLEALEMEAAAAGLSCRALVEVNLTSDSGRTGATAADAARIVAAAAAMPHVEVAGLMGMASVPDGDPSAARREFARLRELRDSLRATVAGGAALGELSMGMSGDFEEAILEGATLVRIGSALFAGLPSAQG